MKGIQVNRPEAASRIIALSTENGLRHLARVSNIFMDDNFAVARAQFLKVRVLLVPFSVYVSVYDELFQAVVDKSEEILVWRWTCKLGSPTLKMAYLGPVAVSGMCCYQPCTLE